MLELYFIFYAVWKLSFVHSINHGDIVLSIDAGQDQLERFSDLASRYGFIIDLSALHSARSSTSIRQDRSFRLVERLVDFCFSHSPSEFLKVRYNPDVMFISRDLIAEIERQHTIQAEGAFTECSMGEVLSVMKNASLPIEADEHRKTFPFSHGTPSPAFMHVPHRRLTDPDNVIRFQGTAMYLTPGTSICADTVSEERFVTSPMENGLVAFGPHTAMPSGTYQLTFDWASICSVDETGDPDPGLVVDIIAEYGAVTCAAPVLFRPGGRAISGMQFTITRAVRAFEPRFTARGLTIQLYGYMVTQTSADLPPFETDTAASADQTDSPSLN